MDPYLEHVGQVGSGTGIVLALNPVLTFSTRKSVFLQNFPYLGPLRFCYISILLENLKNSVKVWQQSCHEPLSQFVSWIGLNVEE